MPCPMAKGGSVDARVLPMIVIVDAVAFSFAGVPLRVLNCLPMYLNPSAMMNASK